MRVCLALAFQNEAPWLRLHLPLWASSGAFAGIVALDGGSQDGGADIVRSMGGQVFERPFDWHFSAHMDALVSHCEQAGYAALLRMDPDELMFPDAIRAAVRALDTFKALRFPRLTFEGDRRHVLPFLFPDYQTRAWHLGHGIRYSGQRVHETIEDSMRAAGWIERGDDDPTGQRDIMRMPHLMLYHYEGLRSGAVRALKHINYHRLMQGQPALERLPEGYEVQNGLRYRVPFEGAQPLDVDAVGPYAPYEGEHTA